MAAQSKVTSPLPMTHPRASESLGFCPTIIMHDTTNTALMRRTVVTHKTSVALRQRRQLVLGLRPAMIPLYAVADFWCQQREMFERDECNKMFKRITNVKNHWGTIMVALILPAKCEEHITVSTWYRKHKHIHTVWHVDLTKRRQQNKPWNKIVSAMAVKCNLDVELNSFYQRINNMHI